MIPKLQSVAVRANIALWHEQDPSYCLRLSADSGTESRTTRFKLNHLLMASSELECYIDNLVAN